MFYLFDIDGTLLLTGGAGSRALNRIFAERYGLDGAMAHISAGGKTDAQIVAEIFETRLERSPEPEEIDTILELYVPLLRAELQDSPRFRLMPAVFECLDFLAVEKVPLGIATGNIRLAAEAKLERAMLAERFGFGGYGCDHVERDRLLAAGIQRGRERLGPIADEAIVVVGDTTRDVDAARACGVTVVAVATGSHDRSELEAAGADAVLDTLLELPAWHRAKATAASKR